MEDVVMEIFLFTPLYAIEHFNYAESGLFFRGTRKI